MSDIASTEFLRLIKFSFDVSSDVLRAYTNAKLIDPHYGGSFICFLDKKKHEFYHKWQASVACCSCGNNFHPTNADMPRWIFDQLYEINSGLQCNQHKLNGMRHRWLCLCQILSKQSLSLDELDISVINWILKVCFLSNSYTENIVAQRNELCHVRKTDKFTKVEYETIWKSLEASTLFLASEVNSYYYKSIQNVLKTTRKYDVDQEEVSKLLDQIDTALKQMHSTQTDACNTILSTVKTEMLDMRSECLKGHMSIKKEIADMSEMDRKHISEEAGRIISEISSKEKDSSQVFKICAENIQESISAANNNVELKINEECRKLHVSIYETHEDVKTGINQVKEDVSSYKRKRKENDEKLAKVIRTEASATNSCIVNATQEMKTEFLKMKEEIVGKITQDISSKFQSIISMSFVNSSENIEQRQAERQICIEAEAECTSWNEQKTLHNLSEDIDKVGIRGDRDSELNIDSVEQKCIQLGLRANAKIFLNSEHLSFAIKLLMERLLKAGEVDTNATGCLRVSLRVKCSLTQEEKDVVYAVFSQSTRSEVGSNKFARTFNAKGDSHIENSPEDETTLAPSKYIKTEYGHSVQAMPKFYVENIEFKVGITGLSIQPEKSVFDSETEQEKCYIQWIWHCSENWNLKSFLLTMNEQVSNITGWFCVDHVYIDPFGRFVLETSTQRHVCNNILSFELAVKSFVEQIVDLCEITFDIPADVSIDVTVLSEMNIDEKKGKGKIPFEDLKSTCQLPTRNADNIVTCGNCKANFVCKKCVDLKKIIAKIKSAYNIKKEGGKVSCDEFLLKQTKQMPTEDELTLYKDLKEIEEEELPNSANGSESESESESEEDTRKDKEIDPVTDSETLIGINRAEKMIQELTVKFNLVERKDKECVKFRKQFIPEIRLSFRPPRGHDSKYKMVSKILDQLRKLKRKINKKIRCFQYIIEEGTTRFDIDQDQICNVNLQSLITCSLCKTLDPMSIMALCTTCSKLMCSSCVLIHLTNTTYHRIEYDANYLRGYKYKSQIDVAYEHKVKAIQCVNSFVLTVFRKQWSAVVAYFAVFGFDTNKKHEIELSRFQGMMFDFSFIVPITDDLVVVTHDIASHMEIINYTNGSILNQISTNRKDGEKIKGVAFISNQLFVGFSNGIDILNMSGEGVGRIDLKDVQIVSPVDNGKLFCRHRNQTSSDIINSYIDIPNNTISTLTDFTCNPSYITIDDEGNFIFSQAGLIFQAGVSGQNSEIIITKDQYNLFDSVSWEHSSKTLCVSSDNHIYIYSKE